MTMKYTVILIMMLLLCVSSIYALNMEGLVLYLPFNEGGGTVAEDASGNGNDGELMGNADWVDGQSGKAVHLHQVTNEWVEVSHSDSLDIMSAITLELWAKVSSMGSHCAFISKATTDQTGSYILHISNDNGFYTCLIVFIGGVQGPWPPPATATTTIGEWHHFAGTYDGAELSVYVDGELKSRANRSTGGDIDSSAAPVVIGRDDRADYWTSRTMDCVLDEVRVWNRVLDADEIAESMTTELISVNPEGALASAWGKVKKGF